MSRERQLLEALEMLSRRGDSITDRVCVGCSSPVSDDDFEDELSRREYRISGLCQKCQDQVFGTE